MGMSVEEKRRSPRIQVEFELDYKLLRRGKVSEFKESSWISSRSLNANEFGISILSNEELFESDVLRVKFVVEDLELNAFCDVVVCMRTEGGAYHVGLEFQFLNDFDQYVYMSFLRNTLRNAGYIL